MMELEKCQKQINQLNSDISNYEILINEKDRTIQLLTNTLEK